jgi:rhamnosyltransferase
VLDYAAVVVMFNPSQTDVENTLRIAAACKTTIIVDNTPAGAAVLSQLTSQPSIKIIKNGKNIGLAAALNIGTKAAAAHGAQWVFLFDQDTRICPDFCDTMWSYCQLQDNNVALIAPNFIDTNLNLECKHFVLKRWRWRELQCGQHDGLSATFAITSGSLVNVEIHHQLGGFLDFLFIDHVDTEYCLRAASQGKKIVINCRAQILHEIGRAKSIRVGPVTIASTDHNSLRRYYHTRNTVIVCRMYGRNLPSLILFCVKDLARVFLGILILEHDKVGRLESMLRGLKDGILTPNACWLTRGKK